MNKGYRFLEEEHRHQILIGEEWKDLIGVTSVTGLISVFGVAAYYGSRRCLMELGYDPKDTPEALDGFQTKVKEILALDPEKQQKALKSAYTAHAKYAKSRATKGTDSHEVLSKWATECLEKNEGKFIDSELPQVKTFLKLATPLIGKARILATEKHAYSEELWLGGITDLIVETEDGKIVVIDYKDRPAIYDKDLLQMGAYTLLYPMPINFVLGVPLEGKEARPWYAVDKLQVAFKGLLECYKFINSLT